ncbi:uncharacterized protein LOC142231293 [Haematobia irritans]|uniref:uncharacterized protein LOC142231293 n=1 Tax=Haematobia irritans TaxID=7368 RepID=UPI003F4F677D
MKKIKNEGLELNGNKIEVKIRAFLADAPATSFVCGIRGHNSLKGCSKCYQEGKSVSNVTVFRTSAAKLRTDEDFKTRLDRDFHSEKYGTEGLSLESLEIKMITQFPLDVMHLVDLGIIFLTIINSLLSCYPK